MHHRTLSLLVFFVTLTVSASIGRASWTQLPVGTSATLRGIGWYIGAGYMIVGDGGTIVATQDGVTFTSLPSGTTEDLNSVSVPTQLQYYVGGTNGTVLYSNDEGQTWTNTGFGTARMSVFTRSSGFLWALGDNGSIQLGNNFAGGGDWEPSASGTTNSLNDGAGFASALVYAVGDNGTMLKAADGETWVPKPSGTTEHLNGFLEAGAAKIAVGANGTILRSIDSAETWTTIPTPTNADLHAVVYSAAGVSRMIAVGDNGVALYSGDHGLSWCLLNTGTTEHLYDVWGIGVLGFLAVGGNGTAIYTEENETDCIAGTATDTFVSPTTHVMSRVSPNPLQRRGQVMLEVTRSQNVQLSVIDLAGRRVAKLGERAVSAGSPVVLGVDTRTLPAGAYFLVVEGETFRDQRKITVLR